MKSKYYYITYEKEEIKEERYKMWKDIKENGNYIETEYSGDYYISKYEYNNKIYELATNMELGVMSYIKEIEV